MGTIQEAAQVLLEAKNRLRQILDSALKAQQYSDVARVAHTAEEVTKLATALAETAERPVAGMRSELHRARVRRPSTGPGNGRKYPIFEREGDRLVKIGWSKKKRAEYEHRASREAVLCFVQHLADHVGEAELFDMESLLPVPDSTGGDVPDYQAYLTLRWLQEVGAVEKRGRDGYLLLTPELGSKLAQFWSAVPVRS